MTDEYTPTTEEVRTRFQRDCARNRDDEPSARVSGADFDRWLTRRDAELLRSAAVDVYALSEDMQRRADLIEDGRR